MAGQLLCFLGLASDGPLPSTAPAPLPYDEGEAREEAARLERRMAQVG